MKNLRFYTGLFLTLATISSTPVNVSAKDKPGDVYFGSVAMDIPAIMHRRLSPLTEYLSEKLKMKVRLKLSPNMSTAINAVSTNDVQIAYLTPVAYLKAHEAGQAHILVKTVTNKRSTFQLSIVVRKDSPIKKVSDLKGKIFAFGDKAALLQRAVVVDAGMPLNKLGSYKFIGHYDNIVRGVLNGDFEAGILKDTKALKWKNKGIRIIHSSPHLPPYNIAASSKLSPKQRKLIRQALLDLDINNPKHKKIIKALSSKYDGFSETSDTEYNVVRKLIAPFVKKK